MSRLRVFTVATVIVSLVGASTTAIAASPVRASASAPAATAAGSWGTLSVMSGSSAATAAMHDIDRDHSHGGFGNVSWLSLAVILATIAAAIYIITRDDKDDLDFNTPISPN